MSRQARFSTEREGAGVTGQPFGDRAGSRSPLRRELTQSVIRSQIHGVPSKNSSVVILLRVSNGSGYLASHGQMAWDPHWDTAIRGSHAPGVGAGEPRASAATRCVEGAPAAVPS